MYLRYVYPWVCIIVSKIYVFEAWCPGTKVPHISFLYIYKSVALTTKLPLLLTSVSMSGCGNFAAGLMVFESLTVIPYTVRP
jgi:hypothetical protein